MLFFDEGIADSVTTWLRSGITSLAGSLAKSYRLERARLRDDQTENTSPLRGGVWANESDVKTPNAAGINPIRVRTLFFMGSTTKSARIQGRTRLCANFPKVEEAQAGFSNPLDLPFTSSARWFVVTRRSWRMNVDLPERD
jgi:hypothetical protein